MPQMYINTNENNFQIAWKTDESLDYFYKLAVQSNIVFPVGWGNWKNETKKKQALQARLICFENLGQAEIFYEQNGKPFLQCGRLSLSHSKNYLAVYFDSKNEIGIDIEEPHDRIKKIAKRFLHKKELAHISGINELTAVWAIKESVFKKYGGKTTFFAENINVLPFTLTTGDNLMTAEVDTEAGMVVQKMHVYCTNDYILAFTIL
jgi:phosphopantetheinyl transferase